MKSEPAHPHDDLPADDPGRWLSALADGEAQALPHACRLWRDDAMARKTWHAYHLIGDVLRSEELARPPARDAAFLSGLRDKLAAEPVILAPAPLTTSGRRRHAWLVPAAVAAGFVVVAGVLVVARTGLPGEQSGGPALAAASSPGVTLVRSNLRPAPLRQRAGEDGVIRDARLDEYLRAHQAARGGVAVAAPGGTLHRVDALTSAGTER